MKLTEQQRELALRVINQYDSLKIYFPYRDDAVQLIEDFLASLNFEEMQKGAASSDDPRLVSYGLEMETCTLNFNGEEYYFDLRDSTASAKQEK